MGREKSNFTVTCSLLSQYLKEKGSFGELMAPKGIYRPPTTIFLPGADVSADDKPETNDTVSDRNVTKSMDLFPLQTGFGPAVPAGEDADTKLPEKADQLTIFYGGRVLVFDNFPAEKAKDLIKMAGKGSSAAPSTTSVAVAQPPNSILPSTPGNLPPVAPNHPPRPAQPNTSDLPIERKASLHRFLEKRKDRINAKAPYQVNAAAAAAAVKPKEAKSWLGFEDHCATN